MLKLELSPEEMYELHSDGHKTFDKIFDQAFQPLCYYISKLSDGSNDGQDLAIETLEKLWQRRRKYNSAEAITGFLILTIRNAYFNIAKREGLFKIFIKSQSTKEPVNEDVSWIEARLITAINEGIETLPHKCKEIFKLIHYKELSNKEVAQILNITENNVAVQKGKAIQLLETYLIKRGYILAAIFLIIFCLKYFFKKHSHLKEQVVSSCVGINQTIH
jgi:RNA polymerase sigma factor (sigma-70 family)